MKEIDQCLFDTNVSYSIEHTWIRVDGGTALVGISDYAQDQLGEIIFVELPEPENHLKKNAVFGLVESVKTSSELYMPISGTVVAVNLTLEDNPELVNSAPFSEGWMLRIEPDDKDEIETLLSAQAYKKILLD